MVGHKGHLLRVVDLHVECEGHKILKGIDLSVAEGTIHILLGANGSGKSTLAYTLMGSAGYRPHRGEIWFGAENITQLSMYERAKRGLTLAWQEPARFEGLSTARYLGLGMPRPDEKRVRMALAAVGLEPDAYLERFVDEALSGGERKRVELAAVFAMRPKLAIMDETDSGIDVLSLDKIWRVLGRMAEEGTTVLLISHRNEVVSVADQASLVVDGRIAETGTPRQVGDLYRRSCLPDWQAGQPSERASDGNGHS